MPASEEILDNAIEQRLREKLLVQLNSRWGNKLLVYVSLLPYSSEIGSESIAKRRCRPF